MLDGIMARFSDVDAFLAVADVGSFRGAAQRLDVTRSTVSRAVARLEDHLGTALFLRDTASVRLTDAGAAYKRGARRAAVALTEAESAARSVSGEISGRIRVTAPPAFGPRWLTKIAAKFLADHPDVAVELVLTDRLVNPILDEVDIAVRTGKLADSDLKSRRLASLEMVAVATPDVAAKIAGKQVVPSVAIARADGSIWRYEGAPVDLQQRLVVDDYLALRDALLRGVGVGVISNILIQEELAAGTLVRVMPKWKLGGGRLWAVYPGRGTTPAKLRRMLDYLVDGFADA